MCHKLVLQELLESQMGMTVDSMRTHMAQNPATSEEHSLPEAHMPIKGFYFTRNLPVAATTSSPRLSSKLLSSRFLKFARPSPAAETLADALPTAFANETEPDVDGAVRR